MAMPAPTGGINARDSLAEMKPNEAVIMVNLFPMQYGCRVRKGYAKHVDRLGAAVETLITYRKADGTEMLFAAAGPSFYDVTTANVGGAAKAAVAGPFANARWQWDGMTNQFGSFVMAVNGADTPQLCTNGVWANANITGPAGFDPKNLIHVKSVHRRLWFVEKNTGNAWFLPTDQVAGAVTMFGVGEVFPRAGFLQAISTWATEGGDGMHDNTVFVSSEGDVAIFTGFDPEATLGDTGSYTLAGTYSIGSTFSRRCLLKYGSDLWILCEDGVFPLSEILSQSKMLMSGAVSNIIMMGLSDDVTKHSKNFGWEMLMSSRNQLVITNVPIVNSPNKQWVMNQVTNAWTTFQGYDAVTFGIREEELYFGTDDGRVLHCWTGDTDNFSDVDIGTSILATCQQAYNYFGQPALQKRWVMMRPIFNSTGYPSVRATVSTDFTLSPTLINPPLVEMRTPPGKWGRGKWNTAKWAGGFQNIRNWYSVTALGYSAAAVIVLQSSSETIWIATDFVMETGGVL
jgi:hypothetical protein